MTAIAGGLTRKCVHWFQSCCYHHYINVMYTIIISWLTSHLVDKIKPNALDRSASQALWYHGMKNKVVTSQYSHIHHRLMVDEFPVNFNTGATNLYWHIFQTVTLAAFRISDRLCTVSLYSIAQLGCATGLPVAFKMVEISTDHMSQNALQLRDLLGYFHTT